MTCFNIGGNLGELFSGPEKHWQSFWLESWLIVQWSREVKFFSVLVRQLKLNEINTIMFLSGILTMINFLAADQGGHWMLHPRCPLGQNMLVLNFCVILLERTAWKMAAAIVQIILLLLTCLILDTDMTVTQWLSMHLAARSHIWTWSQLKCLYLNGSNWK